MMSADLLPLNLLKKDRYVVEHILWDFDPKELMQPRCRIKGEESEPVKIRAGYILYIETMDKNPGLFVMIHTSSGHAETVAKIDGIPDDLLAEAVQENKQKEYFGMYPINKKMEEWLKKELGIEE